MTTHEIKVSTRILDPRSEPHVFKVSPDTSLLNIMQIGAKSATVDLLPPGDKPYDRMHPLDHKGDPGPAIDDLFQTVDIYSGSHAHPPDFGIELARSIRVNTRWEIASAETMTPRQILALFRLDPQEYSLYRERSAALLAPDTAVSTKRGAVFEAQRDGKYGQD